MTEPLLALPCFAGVRREEARLLLRNTELTVLSAGQSVLLGTGPAQELLVVVSGVLRPLRDTWPAGPGAVLGAHALLSRSAPTGFRAEQAAVVAFAGVEQARTLMLGSPSFATAVAVSLSAELDRRLAGVP